MAATAVVRLVCGRSDEPYQQGVLIGCGSLTACMSAAHVQAEVEALVSMCTADNVDELLAGNQPGLTYAQLVQWYGKRTVMQSLLRIYHISET